MKKLDDKNIADFIRKIGLTKFGTAIVFGSFVNNKSGEYNDIDIYIDSDPEFGDEIENILIDYNIEYNISPQYYTKRPFPLPKPFPPRPGKLPFSIAKPLHITICRSADASSQPFYNHMKTRNFIEITDHQ